MKWKRPLVPCAQYIVNFGRSAFALPVRISGLASGYGEIGFPTISQ